MPLDAFARNASAVDGLQGRCRSCAASAYRLKRIGEGRPTRPGDVPAGHKYCFACREVKPFEQWSTSCVTPDGLQSQCKTGASRSNRELHFRKHYGLTVDDVEGMRTAQGGVCAVCTTGPAEHVDHDHRTGAVRGLLCFRCNAALGQLGDDPAVIRRAAVYLERVRAADHRPAV